MIAPRRGHVYRHRRSGLRYVVLSDDVHNGHPYTGRVLVAPISRTGTDSRGNETPYAVNLGDHSGVAGYVRVAEQIQIAIGDLVEPETDELISGADLENIKTVIDEFLGY